MTYEEIKPQASKGNVGQVSPQAIKRIKKSEARIVLGKFGTYTLIRHLAYRHRVGLLSGYGFAMTIVVALPVIRSVVGLIKG